MVDLYAPERLWRQQVATALASGGGSAFEFVSSTPITAVTNIDVAGLGAGYDYVFSFTSAAITADGGGVDVQFSQDGGATFLAGTSYSDNAAGVSAITVVSGIGNDTNEVFSGDVTLRAPGSAGVVKAISFLGSRASTAGTYSQITNGGGALILNTDPVTDIRFTPTSGTFKASGTIAVFRRKLS